MFYNSENIIEVKSSLNSWDYEQANIICPLYNSKILKPLTEQYIIYNVTKEEYDKCQINSRETAKVVAVCNTPYRPRFITLTFRPFSPTPGAFEFYPGENYYFIGIEFVKPTNQRSRSVTSSESLSNQCSHPPMRLVFRIREENKDIQIVPEKAKIDVSGSAYVRSENSNGASPREMPIRKIVSNRSSSASSSKISLCMSILITIYLSALLLCQWSISTSEITEKWEEKENFTYWFEYSFRK